MNKTLAISVIALIAVVMVVGVVSPAMAKEGNNGNNGCEKSGNGKACEANPNTTVTCADCAAALFEGYDACLAVSAAERNACYYDVADAYFACASQTEGGSCEAPPPPDF